MAEIETWDGCVHQTLTEDDVKDIIPSTSQEIEIKNDYCSEDILFLLKNLNVINIFEASYTFAKPPNITHQVVMKWLRKKDIDIVIMPLFKFKGGRLYCYEVHSETADIRTGRFDTYREAVEAALKYTLENLI